MRSDGPVTTVEMDCSCALAPPPLTSDHKRLLRDATPTAPPSFRPFHSSFEAGGVATDETSVTDFYTALVYVEDGKKRVGTRDNMWETRELFSSPGHFCSKDES